MTRKEPISKGRVMEHGKGLGTVTQDMIEKRARENALINGRSQAQLNEADYEQARRDLLGAGEDASSVSDADEAMASHPYSNPGSAGQTAEGQEMDDEQTMAERLVQEGVEEAQHDEMVQGTRASIRRDTD